MKKRKKKNYVVKGILPKPIVNGKKPKFMKDGQGEN